ncbi:uncharacterized protein V6R79_017531 [Siganus canaliculatus]
MPDISVRYHKQEIGQLKRPWCPAAGDAATAAMAAADKSVFAADALGAVDSVCSRFGSARLGGGRPHLSLQWRRR